MKNILRGGANRGFEAMASAYNGDITGCPCTRMRSSLSRPHDVRLSRQFTRN